MTFFALPPVRRPVPFRTRRPDALTWIDRISGSRPVTIYPSGTAALAHALADSAAHSSAGAPEVILPAYGCPDLISACMHASVYPRLVDVSPSAWAFDPESLERSLSHNTVAIIAVNLLGIGDQAATLIPICRAKGIRLIQDSAQFLPRNHPSWVGDYVILSFGRGKPLNLLCDGALIQRSDSDTIAPQRPARFPVRNRILSTRAAAAAFNILTLPQLYRLVANLPGTGLGQVKYSPLDHADSLPRKTWQRIGTALAEYALTPSYARHIWADAIAEWTEFGIIALQCPDTPPQAEPLRLPLLAPDKSARDHLVSRLVQLGLGASRLYGTELTAVNGIPDSVRSQGPFPLARMLADRLFTLPTHSIITRCAVERAREVMRKWHRSRAQP